MERCGWVTQDPLYLAYHDDEWGKPQKDNHTLFEMLCLEGQQAGLSWITVLKKREHYRRCFHGFDPNAIAQMGPEAVDALVLEPGIIRHRGKIEAIIANARAYLAMQSQGEDFARFVWSFVDGAPKINSPATLAQVPVTTPQAQALSKALKKRGFKFVGPTICYAFMQACGLVNDHLAGCGCHPENRP